MKPIKSFEPVTQGTIDGIHSALGAMGARAVDLAQVDITKGCGCIDDHTKCVWTHDRHRIEVWYSSDGGFGAAKSKAPDPGCPEERE